MGRIRLCAERNHLFEPGIYVIQSMVMDKWIDANEMKKAIEYAVNRHEILSCRVVLEQGEAFYEPMEKPNYSFEETNCSFEEIVASEEKKPFHIFEGEFLRFFQRMEGGTSELLLIAHHLAGDGLSIAYLLQDIARSLLGQEIPFHKMHVMTPEEFPAKSNLPFLIRCFIHSMNKKWNKVKVTYDTEDYMNVHQKYYETHSSKLCRHWFTVEETSALVKAKDQMGVSMNTLISVALMKCAAPVNQIGFAINIRTHEDKNMGNYASGGSVKFRYAKDISFMENGKRLQKSIAAYYTNFHKRYFVMHYLTMCQPTFLDSLYMACYTDKVIPVSEKMARYTGYQGEKYGLTLSNIGRLEKIEGVDRMFFAPPIISNCIQNFGLVTQGKRLCISYHCYNGIGTNRKQTYEDTIALLQNIQEELTK